MVVVVVVMVNVVAVVEMLVLRGTMWHYASETLTNVMYCIAFQRSIEEIEVKL